MGASRPKLVVLVSGSGTNLQAILDASRQEAPDSLRVEVALVISNREEAFALERASEAGVPTLVRSHVGLDRETYDRGIAYETTLVGADLVVLAGWDRVLTDEFLSRHRVINLHPAKPGAFPGLGAIGRAFDAWEQGRIDSGGVMVHYVPDEGIDSGPTILWEPVPFEPGDDLASFEKRVHEVEHRVLVEAIRMVIDIDHPRDGSESRMFDQA